MFYYIFLAGSQGQHRHRGETATQQKIENAIRNLHQELITSPIEHSITQVDRTQVPLCRDLSELQLPLSFFPLPLTLLLSLPSCHPRASASNWLRPVCLLFSLLWSIRPNGLSSGCLWGTLHWSTNDAHSVYGHLISMSAPLKWLMFRSGSQRPSKALKKM